jgi:hypothetical protein
MLVSLLGVRSQVDDSVIMWRAHDRPSALPSIRRMPGAQGRVAPLPHRLLLVTISGVLTGCESDPG